MKLEETQEFRLWQKSYSNIDNSNIIKLLWESYKNVTCFCAFYILFSINIYAFCIKLFRKRVSIMHNIIQNTLYIYKCFSYTEIYVTREFGVRQTAKKYYSAAELQLFCSNVDNKLNANSNQIS